MDLKILQNLFQAFEPDEALRQKALEELAPDRSLHYPQEKIDRARKAGVLLNVFQDTDGLYFTLIERPRYEGVHSGQIALPGGKAENFDQDIIATAVREAHEEVNIHPKAVQVITSLPSIYIPPSNFLVTPVLSFCTERPDFKADPREVHSIIQVPLRDLLREPIISSTTVELKGGFKLKTNYLAIQDKIVWGATAIILNDFRHHLKTVF